MSNTEQQPRHATVMDDEARHVARVYADALYTAAERQGAVDEVLGELETLVDAFARDPGLELLFSSASIGESRKKEMIERAFSGRASQTFTNFLGVLNHHGRLYMLRPIAQALRTKHERKHKRFVVQVRSAVPLNDDERQRLADDLRSVAEMEPVLQETVDPAILGGLIVRVQDWVYDASVRTRLENIRNQLIERSSHGIQSGRDRFGSD